MRTVVWQSTVVMFLCLFKDNFSVLDHLCLKQNSPRRSNVTILFLLKVYFHDRVSKANFVVNNHFSKCIYLSLRSVILSICFLNCFFGMLFVFQTAGALWFWLKSGSLGCSVSVFDWQNYPSFPWAGTDDLPHWPSNTTSCYIKT